MLLATPSSAPQSQEGRKKGRRVLCRDIHPMSSNIQSVTVEADGSISVQESDEHSSLDSSNNSIADGRVSSANTRTALQHPTAGANTDSDTAIPTDLRDKIKRIAVVTTASLPWRTGTAVNPLARALHLSRGRKAGHVTLAIPWLATPQEQAKVYGSGTSMPFFETQADQIEWIREYCSERMGCADEAKDIEFLFYEATFNDSFGSIFATEDICSLISTESADVVILEEPEHLNWFRVPPTMEAEKGEDTPGPVKSQSHLGWTAKFPYVIGILHTNYAAYVNQYGYSTVIASAAVDVFSKLVVQAYCHRLIRLSATLPCFDPAKEVTSNVHGVRDEFLQSESTEANRQPNTAVSTNVMSNKSNNGNSGGTADTGDSNDNDNSTTNGDSNGSNSLYPIYFIGKIIWAKGFGQLLHLQESYRARTGEYFGMDVYGSGKDENAIRRAFFGRVGRRRKAKVHKDCNSIISNGSGDAESGDGSSDNSSDGYDGKRASRSMTSKQDQAAAAVFEAPSIRQKINSHPLHDDTPLLIPAMDTSTATTATMTTTTTTSQNQASMEGSTADHDLDPQPLLVVSESWNESVQCASVATDAIKQIATDVVTVGMKIGFREGESKEPTVSKTDLLFDPPASRFELRYVALPAKFHGVKDHAMLREMRQHKIFLNMSETEVLCTTTAEALAMGKFVIIPNHKSNTFFEQFSNCLTFSSHDEAIDCIEWALQNEPKPLSVNETRCLSWEGAMERLYDVSTLTTAQYDQITETDHKLVNFHMETMKNGLMLQNLFCAGD